MFVTSSNDSCYSRDNKDRATKKEGGQTKRREHARSRRPRGKEAERSPKGNRVSNLENWIARYRPSQSKDLGHDLEKCEKLSRLDQTLNR